MPRILVLDDEPLISMMLEEWLTELGYETLGPANSVRSALDFIANAALDAAILDVSLGDEQCYSVADALRGRGIPFALATGHGAHGVDIRFKDALVLSKPFDFEEVRDVMAKLFDNPVRP
jgi:DNA-binding response OmpR family regulator